MSVDTLIARYASEFCVLRFGEPVFEKGRLIEIPEPDRIIHEGIIQPIKPEALQRFPELSRTEGAHVIYTTAELKVGRNPDEQPDRIEFGGLVYEVEDVSDFSHIPHLGLNGYRRYIVTKAEQ